MEWARNLDQWYPPAMTCPGWRLFVAALHGLVARLVSRRPLTRWVRAGGWNTRTVRLGISVLLRSLAHPQDAKAGTAMSRFVTGKAKTAVRVRWRQPEGDQC